MKVMTVFGTRPEAIKMAPVVQALSMASEVEATVCVTGQHREILDQILDLFDIRPDFDLNVMVPGQTLSEITRAVLKGLDGVFSGYRPDLVLVHGDTATTFAVSLSAYHHRIAVGHVEAGLRSGDMYAPWPEEGNRKMTGVLANVHFAPTEQAKNNLLLENIPGERIHVTGNTVIDSLFKIISCIDGDPDFAITANKQYPFISPCRRFVLITGHRRENFGEGFARICSAIRLLASEFPSVDFVYPIHPNPNIREPAHHLLGGLDNVFLLEPQNYLSFVWLMRRAYILLTDSGGIQEEAAALGKPVLVMRDLTERQEALGAGVAVLVGTDENRIVDWCRRLLIDEHLYASMSNAENPFGDGNAADRIVAAIRSGSWVECN